MATQLQNGQTILCTGDSITDCGRRDLQYKPYGHGYVRMLRDMVITREPEKHIQFINTGIGGNTVEDLRSRWIDDVIAYKPDWLTIKIGINDCNRYLTSPQDHALQSPEKYAELYDEVLACTQKLLPQTQIVLIDPFIGTLDKNQDLPDSYRSKVWQALPSYIQTVDELSNKYNCRHVKTNDIFHEIFKHQHPEVFFPTEPVHPNHTGHTLIAEAVYEALQ